jgi:hypothetical protein
LPRVIETQRTRVGRAADLAPHTTRRVVVRAQAERLRLVGAHGRFELLPGEYSLHVGGSPPSEHVVRRPLRPFWRSF